MLQRFRLVKAIKALMRANMSLQDFLPKLWKMELNTEACRRYRNCKKDVMKDCEARASRASAMNDLEEDCPPKQQHANRAQSQDRVPRAPQNARSSKWRQEALHGGRRSRLSIQS